MALRFQRRGVGSQRQHVVLGELGDDLGHERRPRAFARAGLHVIHLAHEVTGRAAGEAGDGAEPLEVVGTYDRQFGNYAEWRGLGAVGWSFGSFDALLTARYVDSLELLNPDNANPDAPPLQIPSFTYFDLTASYTWRENTRLQVGVSNLADEEPPILYQNNVINANTDVSTYDTIGRRYWVSVSQKF